MTLISQLSEQIIKKENWIKKKPAQVYVISRNVPHELHIVFRFVNFYLINLARLVDCGLRD